MSGRHRRGLLPRVVALTAALTLVATPLGVGPAVAAEADPPRPADAAEAALADLRDEASGDVEVARDDAGAVTSVVSADGSAVLETATGSPTRATAEVLDEHGEAFGLDGEVSEAVVTQTVPSATGGTVVRAQQEVDGVPVFGGQVVTVLDEDADVVSLEAATTREPVEASRPEVAAATAVRTAVRASARAHDLDADALEGELLGRRLFDPSLVGVTTPGGTRPVWEVEVRDGAAVRDTVLVGTDRGEVALRFDNAPRATSRWLCDRDNLRLADEAVTGQVPVCASATLRDDDSPRYDPFDPDSDDEDAVATWHAMRATADTYDALRGADATPFVELVGTQVDGRSRLVAQTDYCPAQGRCAFDNAFWDGRSVVLGDGYGLADDVIAHELTHGYVERTANLFYFQQSGAINESFADIIGEIVDHRHDTGDAAQDAADWTVGEDSPLVPRSLRDPTLQDLPDRMTSDLWVDEHGALTDWRGMVTYGRDNGGVHSNLGVGNKTAYLISQGGDFNGQTIVGVDADDPGLSKTGLLYLEVIPTLTSAADYADLGRALEATCARLASAGTGGFVATDCVSVRQAVLATELAQAPAVGGQPVEVERSCPAGTTQVLHARDDDAREVAATTPGVPGFGFTIAPATLAGYLGAGSHGQYAVSGEESLLLLDPDPTRPLGGAFEPSSVTARSASLRVPVASGGSYLHFHHAYSLDEDEDGYWDAARVRVFRERSDGGWEEVRSLVWANGPDHTIQDSSEKGFGGDSRGWGSSRLDLTSLAGQNVKVQFGIEADDRFAAYGWWLDDIRLYSCRGPAPGAPAAVTAVSTSTTSARISWQASTGSLISGYQVLRNGAEVVRAAAGVTSHTVSGLTPGSTVTLGVRALASDGQASPVVSRVVSIPKPPPVVKPSPTPTPTPTPTAKPSTRPTPTPTVTPTVKPAVKPAPVVRKAVRAVTTTSKSRVRRNQAFVVRGTAVVRGSGAKVRGVRITLQRRVAGTSRWRTVSARTTRADGTYRWKVRQTRSTAYRVVVAGGRTTLRSVSPTRGVRLVR